MSYQQTSLIAEPASQHTILFSHPSPISTGTEDGQIAAVPEGLSPAPAGLILPGSLKL